MTDEEFTAYQKKYAGLWHIEDPYDKAIETARFARMCCIIQDDDYTRGFMDASRKIEKALRELKALEEERMR